VSDTQLHNPREWLNKEEKSFSTRVENQEKLNKTIYAGSKTLDEYFAANSAFMTNRSIVKRGILGGEDAVWFNGEAAPDVIVFHNGTLFELNGSDIDPQTFNTILSTSQFIN